jgi:hypothetical protein
MHKIQRYGWHAPSKAKLDRAFKFTPEIATANLPPHVDLRGICIPDAVYDQGQLGSCHDDQTEVLTEDGWKLFAENCLGDKLATVDPITSELTYETPSTFTAYHYDGDIYYGSHQNLDFAVTPNHKMLVRPWIQKNRTLSDQYQLIEMQNVGWYAGLMNSVKREAAQDVEYYILPSVSSTYGQDYKPAVNPARQVTMKTWLKFIGIYLAEGTIITSDRYEDQDVNGVLTRVKTRAEYKVQIAGVKQREREFIIEVLSDLGVGYCELDDRFTFSNKQIVTEMERLGLKGVKAPHKFVPDFVFQQSQEQIEEFLLGHVMGDGCIDDAVRCHYTSSSKLADDLQRLNFLAGHWSNISTRPARSSIMKDGRKVNGKHPEHRISCWLSKELSIDRKANVQVRHYDGMVYCAEVPTHHTLVTRRNGKILISGNCTANATAALAQTLMIKEKKPSFMPSRNFIYYNERVMEGTVTQDSGAQLADGMAVLANSGVPHESLWPYTGNRWLWKPTASVSADALKHRVAQEQNLVQDLNHFKACLAAGYPFVGGFTVYESFESEQVAQTGVVNMPAKSEQTVGGHAILIVGYDDATNRFIVRNSWGNSWGMKGYFTIPYDYYTDADLATDFWTATSISI